MPGHHHHHRGRHHGQRGRDRHDRVVEKLHYLQHALQFATVGALADAAERIKPGGLDAAAYLREYGGEASIELALAKLEIKRWEDSLSRQQTLIERGGQSGAAITVILPLPPHLFREVIGLGTSITVVALDGHEAPPGFAFAALCRDPIEARRAVRGADVVLFDAYAGEDTVVTRQHLADLLDPAILKPEAHLGVHYRPSRMPDDVPLASAITDRLIEL